MKEEITGMNERYEILQELLYEANEYNAYLLERISILNTRIINMENAKNEDKIKFERLAEYSISLEKFFYSTYKEVLNTISIINQ